MSLPKATPLLELLESRKAWEGYEELQKLGLPVYRVPDFDPSQRLRQRQAAYEHAKANASDPFAYGRITLHMARGLEAADEVSKAARDRLVSKSKGW